MVLSEAELSRGAQLLVEARSIDDVDAALDEISAYWSHDRGLVLGARVEGRLAGVAIGSFDGYRGTLRRVAIDAHLRRRGIASSLVSALEERLIERGARLLRLHVERENEPAQALWTARGYVPIAVTYMGKPVDPPPVTGY